MHCSSSAPVCIVMSGSTAIFPTREMSILRALDHLFSYYVPQNLVGLQKALFFALKALVLFPIGCCLQLANRRLSERCLMARPWGQRTGSH